MTTQIEIHEMGHITIAHLQGITTETIYREDGATTDYIDIPEVLLADIESTLLRTTAGIAAEMEFTGIAFEDTGFATDLPKMRTFLRWLGKEETEIPNYIARVRKMLRDQKL